MMEVLLWLATLSVRKPVLSQYENMLWVFQLSNFVLTQPCCFIFIRAASSAEVPVSAACAADPLLMKPSAAARSSASLTVIGFDLRAARRSPCRRCVLGRLSNYEPICFVGARSLCTFCRCILTLPNMSERGVRCHTNEEISSVFEAGVSCWVARDDS